MSATKIGDLADQKNLSENLVGIDRLIDSEDAIAPALRERGAGAFFLSSRKAAEQGPFSALAHSSTPRQRAVTALREWDVLAIPNVGALLVGSRRLPICLGEVDARGAVRVRDIRFGPVLGSRLLWQRAVTT
jgi:hypothetical protein